MKRSKFAWGCTKMFRTSETCWTGRPVGNEENEDEEGNEDDEDNEDGVDD